MKLVVDNFRAQRHDRALQGKQLNFVREDCDSTENRRDSSVLEFQYMGTGREATEEGLDNSALLAEQLNVVREDGGNIAKEKCSSVLEVQQTGTDKQAKEEDLDDNALLEEQSDLVREDWGNLEKERDYLEIKCNT
jgi:hypothetical protein